MKRIHILTFLLLAAFITSSCYKDKGNYTYSKPEAPAINNLDTLYYAVVGDSLVIDPKVTIGNAAHLSLEWKIGGPDLESDLVYTGDQLRIIFSLGATHYDGHLTITNNDNGMKYFKDFSIQGRTDFSTGTTVLSKENGITQLSFIKNDGSIRPRIYEALNGAALPNNPTRLLGLIKENIVPRAVTSYWIITNDGVNGGVQVDANNLKKIKTLANNYFDPPSSLTVNNLEDNTSGTLQGVIDGKFVWGYDLTWNQAPIYGMFGVPLEGDYQLSPWFIYNNAATPFYIGYDVNTKSFLRINLYGTPVFFGTNYESIDTAGAFDPKNVGLDLIHMKQINNNYCYAFGKDASGTLYELRFVVNFNGPFTFTTNYKRAFKQPELITANTKWQSTDDRIFYFSSGTKVYRYNPESQTIQPLAADFGSKEVSMLKLLNQNTLVAGIDNKLLYLDIQTGSSGNIIKTIEGIPGTPIDIYQRD
ncbi:PKD-like family protein [Filimonas lacunae]|uniref:PKD-like family protein n=1 Tax=Filimonas lacunae TaxID=477680 RepID=A0A173MC88_9BACT|nr:PKD-like family lipoprotein [Filimonas lacunae]BAV05120.1 hypothetical protein FLA_1127 [Filimonas lacunae]SIT34199.1 PKD-like family protein [Filimonas lacunae]